MGDELDHVKWGSRALHARANPATSQEGSGTDMPRWRCADLLDLRIARLREFAKTAIGGCFGPHLHTSAANGLVHVLTRRDGDRNSAVHAVV